MSHIMLIGAGDLGQRTADMLIRREKVSEMTMVDLPEGGGANNAEYMAACNPLPIHFEGANCMDTSAVEAVINRRKPDVIIFGASLGTTETVMRSEDPRAKAMFKAGMGVQLAFQIPILLSVMKAVKSVAPDLPVLNFTVPDVCHKILQGGDLCPAAGLGNPGIMQVRTRANMVRKGTTVADLPEIRIIGGFSYAIPVIFGQAPENKEDEPMVFLGDDGTRAETSDIYGGRDLYQFLPVNYLTAISALPVIEALLPGGADCQTNSPGLLGMFGGYPAKISDQKIELDLPNGISLDEAIEINEASMPVTGIERIDADGTVHYNDAAISVMADVEPRLTEPYNPHTDTTDRTATVMGLMREFRKA